jgi:hypothetical protein
MGGITRPSSAVYWRGHWFDPQTAAMLQELADTSGAIYVRPIQGCWSTSTAKSSGTHARACVVDVDCEGLTDAEAVWLETKWRSMGGGGWFRPRTSPSGYVYGWQRHAHLFHPNGDLADDLRDQWGDYLAGRNGLANNGPDTGTRAYVGMTWARYQEGQEDDMALSDEQYKDLLAAIKMIPAQVWHTQLTGHDEDGPGPLVAPRAPATSWLVMARRDAGRTYWNTDTLEGAQAQLLATAQRSGELLDRLADQADQGEAADPDLVAELRQLLSSVRLELVPVTEEGTPA